MLKSSEAAHLDPGFQALTDLAYREAGLVLSPGKAAMIQSRLRHRLRALGLQTLQDYCAYVNTDGD
jgi:chemotaxis protein methyltransferase CheR